MKKLFIIIIPLTITIAVLFALQSRKYDLISMLNTFSNWKFDTFLDALKEFAEKVASISNNWTNISYSWNIVENIFKIVRAIGSTIVDLFSSVVLIFNFIGRFLIDLFNNVTNIFNYLLGTDLHIG